MINDQNVLFALAGAAVGWIARGILLHFFWRREFFHRLPEQIGQTIDANCPHCYGIGYDASGQRCTCAKDQP